MGDFNEEQHPREDHSGKFSDGGGGSGPSLKEKMKQVSSNPVSAFVKAHTEQATEAPKFSKGRGKPHVVEQHTAQGVIRHETNSKQEAHALSGKLAKEGHKVTVSESAGAHALHGSKQVDKPPSAAFAAPSTPATHQEEKPPAASFGASPKGHEQAPKPSAAAFEAPKGAPSEHQLKGAPEPAFGKSPAAPSEFQKSQADKPPPAHFEQPKDTPAKVAEHVTEKFAFMKTPEKLNPVEHEAKEGEKSPEEKHPSVPHPEHTEAKPTEEAKPAEHKADEAKPAEAKPAEAKAPKEPKAKGTKSKGSSKPKGGHEAKDDHGGLGAWIHERMKGVRETVKEVGEKANKFQEAAMHGDPITMGFKAAGGAIDNANEAIEKAPVGHGM